MLPFVLLALSICAIWAPPLPIIGGRSMPTWLLLLIAAVVAGLIAGVLTGSAVAALALLIALAWASERAKDATARRALITLTVVLALAIALHRVPGFLNLLIADRVRLTPDATPYTLYANFDKGAVGAVLLAFYAPHVRSWKEGGTLLAPTMVVAVATSALVFATALAIGHVGFAPKLVPLTWTFLAVNLFFVCVAEEALFRGLLQERMARMLEGRGRLGVAVSVAVSALLFGLAHAGGGPTLVVLATLAGLGYAGIYARTRRIEAAIGVHFLVNATHFLLFAYPGLQR